MNKQTYPWIIAGVVVAVILIVVALQRGVGVPGPATPTGLEPGEESVVLGEDVFRPEDPLALETVEGGTRRVIQETIRTPEAGEEPPRADVAVPTSVVNIGIIQRRAFDLKGEGQKFVPSTLVVNEGDILRIDLTAVDADYDIWLPDFGVYKLVSRGTTERVQFQITGRGEYEFFCRDSCRREVKGKIITNEK